MESGKHLRKFSDGDVRTSFPYRELIGALIFISVCTRPDVSFSVNKHAQFFSDATDEHFGSALRILAYLASTKNFGLSLGGRSSLEIRAYVDADFAGDLDTRLSTTGNLIYIGDSLISWASKRQKLIATSSTEAEYLAVFYSLRDIQYIEQVLRSVFSDQHFNIVVYQDNMSTIALIRNESSKGRCKHFDVKLKSVSAALRNGFFNLEHVSTQEMWADMLTKALNRNLFSRIRPKLLTG